MADEDSTVPVSAKQLVWLAEAERLLDEARARLRASREWHGSDGVGHVTLAQAATRQALINLDVLVGSITTGYVEKIGRGGASK
jgi:hypothetical protein